MVRPSAEQTVGSRKIMNPLLLDRITFDPRRMGGKPCLRNMRVTVGMIVGLVASGYSHAQILSAYPYLEEEDILQSLAYAAWRSEEIELPLVRA